MVQITGCKMKIGTDADITTLKDVVYSEQPGDPKPATVMNVVNPVDFFMFHKWVKGEIHAEGILSGIQSYISPTGNNTKNLTMVVTGSLVDGGTAQTFTFAGAMFVGPGITVKDGEYAIIVYPFVAKSVSVA